MQEKPSVLIVDDERADLTGLERDLAPLGFRLLTLQDGHQLLDRVRAERPDLVLLDALLPGLSGFDLCKQIKTSAEGKNTLVVILTGVYVKDQYRQDAMRQFKADGFVTKPYRAPELHRLVLRLMSKKLRTTPAELRQMLREMSKAMPPGDGSPLAPAEEKKGWLSRLFGRARPVEPLSLESIAPVAPPPTPRVQVVGEAAPATKPTEVGQTERTAIQLGPGEPVMPAMPGMAEPPPPSSAEEPPPAAMPAEEPGPAAESPGSLESPEPDPAGPPREETPGVPAEPEPLPPPPLTNQETLLEAFEPVEAVAERPRDAQSEETVEAGIGSAPEEARSGPASALRASARPSRSLGDAGPLLAEPSSGATESSESEAPAAAVAEEEAPQSLLPLEERHPAEPLEAKSAEAPVSVSSAPLSHVPDAPEVPEVPEVPGVPKVPLLEEAGQLPLPPKPLPMRETRTRENVLPLPHETQPGTSEAIIERLTEAQHAIFEDIFRPEPPPPAAPVTAQPAAVTTPAAAPPRPFFVSVQPGLPIYREEAFFGELKREISRCRRAGKPLTLLLIRVDDLAQIAELFGQESKNQVLQHVAELAVETARDVDMAGLLVSMELVGLTAFASDRYGGGRIAARILRAATRRPFVVAEGFPPIIPALRFGMATFPTDTEGLEDLVFRAREELASSAPRKASPDPK